MMGQIAVLDDLERVRLQQMLRFEEEAYLEGYRSIAGVDEAGRGPLAGPVVAAACILPRGLLINGVNDSKQIIPKIREELFERLTTDPSIVYGIGIIDSDQIDSLNIYQATIHAMWQAVNQLDPPPDCLLVDGMALSHKSLPCRKIIKGDQLSLSVAAASIIAKVTRDRLMREFHEKWPQYGFNRHKGYGVPNHLDALKQYGPCPIHRYSFDPVKSLSKK